MSYRDIVDYRDKRHSCCCGVCEMHITTGTIVIMTINFSAALYSFFGSGVVPLHLSSVMASAGMQNMNVPPMMPMQPPMDPGNPGGQSAPITQNDFVLQRSFGQQNSQPGNPNDNPWYQNQNSYADYFNTNNNNNNGRKKRQAGTPQGMALQSAASQSGMNMANGITSLIVFVLTLVAVLIASPMLLVPLLTHQACCLVILAILIVSMFIAAIVLCATGLAVVGGIVFAVWFLVIGLTVLEYFAWKVFVRCYEYLKEKQRFYSSPAQTGMSLGFNGVTIEPSVPSPKKH